MKHVGLLLVAFGFVAAVVYSYLLAGLGIDLPFHWAVPLAALSTLLWSRIQVRQLAQHRATALGRHPREWRDGEQVAFAGLLRPRRDALVAPASGEPAAIYWFQITRYMRVIKGNSKTGVHRLLLTGAGRLACEVSGPTGSVTLVGISDMLNVKQYSTQDPARMVALCEQVVRKPPHVWTSSDPRGREAELGSLFADAELDVIESFREPEGYFTTVLKLVETKTASDGVEAGVRELYASLKNDALAERRLAPGAEVCAFGRYDAARQQLDVGASHDSNHRDLIAGSAEQVGKRGLRWATVWLVVSALLWAGGHALVWQFAGRVEPVNAEVEEAP